MNYDYRLDEEEQEILNNFESGALQSVDNEEEYMMKARQAAKNSIEKRKAVSIRFAELDIKNAKKRALEEGIPYQTLISSVLHRYLNGTLVPAKKSSV